ncbi:MAG: hypothetical protein H7Z16_19735 [Pyrinomonadaceae bacterium]|nr:hypothetical protein [Pyrinomonadaceae bacterium]
MSKVRFTLNMLAVAVFVLTVTSMASAQATRTWVSGVGDDVNPCSRTAPCKTYAGAISKTAKDGEISTLDPGGFGTLTITKSITVNGGGAGQGYGSVLAALAPQGFLINITDAADVRKTVRLNWLDINGASTGTDGIRFIAGTALFVENTNIDGFVQEGIDISASSQAINQLHLRNVMIRNVATGININNTSTNATQMTLDNVNISKTTNCLNAGNGSRGQISHSFFSSCTGSGINSTQGSSPSDIAINDSSITGSGTGITVGAGTRVRAARVVITGNGNALGVAGGGFVDTGGNNTIMGNGTNQDPNGTLFIQK